MTESTYNVIQPETGVPIKAWTKGVTIEAVAEKQLRNVAAMPFVYKWVAAMPDVHWGIGATVGSVIPTKGAIIPAAVGVDIGCGMMAVQTTLTANHLPDRDLAYFKEGSEHFEDYVDAVSWAQEFAMYNRKLMMEQLTDAVAECGQLPTFTMTETAVNCHHNYVAREEHYGAQVFVTRK